MTDLGRLNKLVVAKTVDFGVYLNSDDYGEILLPKKYVPEDCGIGDELTVFVYTDSEDRIIATTQFPKAKVGEFAKLLVKDVNNVGAFLDWGLEKDLFVPFKEQKHKMEAGEYYVVFIYVDKRTNRIVASSKLNTFLDACPEKYFIGDEVNILVADELELGFPVVVNEYYAGMIYKNQIFQDVAIGAQLKAFIKNIRPDGLIDLTLQKAGYTKVSPLSEQILEKMRLQGGYIPLNSKSSPEHISKLFKCSKKTFKMAIGSLYKERLITITDDGIKLAPQKGNK
ncbi:MAG: S1-like domain-containing RNA-binding protein [Lentisphaeraceae bacterium]|nr:S1-like domain-containing RNA-binding protein [Lentisphaeraceae bacterium]